MTNYNIEMVRSLNVNATVAIIKDYIQAVVIVSLTL